MKRSGGEGRGKERPGCKRGEGWGWGIRVYRRRKCNKNGGRAQGWRGTLKSGTNHQRGKITAWSSQRISVFLHQFIPLNPSATQMRGEVRSAEIPSLSDFSHPSCRSGRLERTWLESLHGHPPDIYRLTNSFFGVDLLRSNV